MSMADALWDRARIAKARIMGIADQLGLNDDAHRRLRGIVLHEVDEVTDLACAFIRALDDSEVNDLVVRMLSEVHSAIVPNGA
jgi:hypothetical protein